VVEQEDEQYDAGAVGAFAAPTSAERGPRPTRRQQWLPVAGMAVAATASRLDALETRFLQPVNQALFFVTAFS